jgi:hypothetical protein
MHLIQYYLSKMATLETADEMYELLTEVDRESYSPASFSPKLQTVCDSIDVTFDKNKKSSHRFEVQPGHFHKKTLLMLSYEDGPEEPIYYRRPSRAGFSALLEMAEGYDAVVSIGPYSVECVTSTAAHQYLTTEVDEDISGVPHLSHLTIESCEKIIGTFFNPQTTTDSQATTDTWDTKQKSFHDYQQQDS